jgi:hypothetical protein
MTTSLDPGRVAVNLQVAGGRVAAAVAASVRPRVARVLAGQPAGRAVELVPLLFSICGRAQGTAARLALAAARGETMPARHDPVVAAEIAGEHLWRLLLDWPRLLGLPGDEALFLTARRHLALPGFPDWARQQLQPAMDALFAALAGHAEPIGAAAPLLPVMDATASLACWPRLDDDFGALPTWRGQAAETGALARVPAQADGPILARVRARWAEVLEPPGQVSAVPVAPGIGRALVDTARGLLMHELRLDGGRIADYVIVAPTEWNFHPEGSLAGWLGNAPATGARALAERALLALDACVPTRLTVNGDET